jgi:hypothetical protein
MKEIREGGFSAETDFGSHVGLHRISPDTIVLVFQRTRNDGETITVTMPLSTTAFLTLMALGEPMKKLIAKEEGNVPQ